MRNLVFIDGSLCSGYKEGRPRDRRGRAGMSDYVAIISSCKLRHCAEERELGIPLGPDLCI